MFSVIVCFVVIVGIFVYKCFRHSETGRKFRAKRLGEAGERSVAFKLGKTIPGEQYVLNNFMFRDKEGNSHQIDHILINRSAIWVVETKNYSGRIYGDEDRKEWTQVLAYGHKKERFYNPVRQNWTHIYQLAEYLDLDRRLFRNVVVFAGDADIRYVASANVYTIEKLRTIRKTETGISLPVELMESVYARLFAGEDAPFVDLESHVQSIQEREIQLSEGICPRCGKNLVLRHGESGDFYGCSGFPKCKFTTSVKNVRLR